MPIKANFTGDKQLLRNIAKLRGAMRQDVLENAARSALQPFDAAWREKAPRRSGHLAESGGIGKELTPRQARLAGSSPNRDGNVTMYAGPGGDPAAIQEEFGNVHQAAHPFVRPAWEETKDEMVDTLGEKLWAAIERAVK